MKYTKLKKITQFLLFTFLISWIFFSISKKSLAAPVINSANGIFTDGEIVNIFGLDFGHAIPNVLFFDNFENGTVGQDIKTGTNSATIGQWLSMGINSPKYSSDTAVGGNQSLKAITVFGDEGHTNGLIALPDVTEIFLSYWVYVPSDSPWSGEGTINGINWKIMWLIENIYSQTCVSGYDDLIVPAQLSETNYLVGGNCTPLAYPDTEPWQSSAMAKGLWHRYWLWLKDGDTVNNDGSLKIWELTEAGPVLIKSINNKATIHAGHVRKYLSVNGYTRMMPDIQATQMFDDIYVAIGVGSQSRIEIGNASTYTESTNLAIATVDSWLDNEIQAIIRQGSFNNGDTAYLYVVDENGEVNENGYPITIGSESQVLRADVDNSGTTNTTDALLALRNSLGLSMNGTAWQIGETTGDVNCDSESNSTDALLILRYSLGLEMEETGWCE